MQAIVKTFKNLSQRFSLHRAAALEKQAGGPSAQLRFSFEKQMSLASRFWTVPAKH